MRPTSPSSAEVFTHRLGLLARRRWRSKSYSTLSGLTSHFAPVNRVRIRGSAYDRGLISILALDFRVEEETFTWAFIASGKTYPVLNRYFVSCTHSRPREARRCGSCSLSFPSASLRFDNLIPVYRPSSSVAREKIEEGFLAEDIDPLVATIATEEVLETLNSFLPFVSFDSGPPVG